MNAPDRLWSLAMSYAVPEYPLDQVNWSGKILRWIGKGGDNVEKPSADDVQRAFAILDNWRASHAFPLNTLYVTLRNRAKRIDNRSLSAQRIKRLISIFNKLVDQEGMKLSQMQDIGGCRAILPSLKDVYELRKTYASRPTTHSFSGEKDYIIEEPKASGYRGIHLKYRFKGRKTSAPWDQLKIELQLRTSLQHSWATAVEAAGTFNKQALKSAKGNPEWLRFFALMSSVFAIREGCPTIPATPTTLAELGDEIRELNSRHYIAAVFEQYRTIIPHIERQTDATYFLVTLDPANKRVDVQGFRAEASQDANRAYTEAEMRLRDETQTNVVLVSVSSVKALRRAYPNYFLDTEGFLREVRSITG